MFRRETAVKAYHYALTQVTEKELQRKRQRLWTRPDAEFFEFNRSMQAYDASLRPENTMIVIPPTNEFFDFFNRSAGRRGIDK